MTATLLTPRRPLTILPQPEWTGMAPLPLDQAGEGDRESYPRPVSRRALHVQLPAELGRPVPHGLPAHSGPYSLWVEPAAVVGHLDIGELTVESQLYPDVFGLCVAADVR